MTEPDYDGWLCYFIRFILLPVEIFIFVKFLSENYGKLRIISIRGKVVVKGGDYGKEFCEADGKGK